jgi:uncharacterized protein (DUF2236 family)
MVMLVSQRVNRERVVVLGWGRAILLQLAHPLVAAGVAEHSGFAVSRWARLERLRATFGAMVDLSFGDEGRRRQTAARINAIHERVHGELAAGVGRYPRGAWYTATDPELLRWVHATLLDSIPLAHERFVGPLTLEDKDRYCAESGEVGRLLRIPDAMLLRRASDVTRVLDEGLNGGEIAVGPQARSVAAKLLYPPLTDPTRPAAWLTRLVTLGLLPPAIRDAYGFPWSAGRETSLRIVSATIRRLLPLMPGFVRYWPLRPSPFAAARRDRAERVDGNGGPHGFSREQ